MRKDPYVIGATIFTWGSFGGAWADFDVTGTEVARRIVQHVRDSR